VVRVQIQYESLRRDTVRAVTGRENARIFACGG
jgi:hypothetical protein